ncbi:MAG: DPP IV N-terminal domain-containing protein, partial [Gemmatimonadales bacterium]
MFRIRLAAVLVSLPSVIAAQVPAPLSGAIDRIFASREFLARERFGPAVWIENGAAYTTVERAASGPGADIVRYDTRTGARSVLVPAARLTPAGTSTPLDIEDYQLSGDQSLLLVFTNSERVWRQNTRGDFWLFDLRTGSLRQLGGPEAPASSLMYAKLSPTGDRVAYVRQGDLYVEGVGDRTITRLTATGDSLHVNGMSDWVYEEEFGVRDGFRWSPDGKRIAYWNFDMTGVGTFRLINDTDSLYP